MLNITLAVILTIGAAQAKEPTPIVLPPGGWIALPEIPCPVRILPVRVGNENRVQVNLGESVFQGVRLRIKAPRGVVYEVTADAAGLLQILSYPVGRKP
jgi:hypothetical protein